MAVNNQRGIVPIQGRLNNVRRKGASDLRWRRFAAKREINCVADTTVRWRGGGDKVAGYLESLASQLSQRGCRVQLCVDRRGSRSNWRRLEFDAPSRKSKKGAEIV